MKIGVYNRYWHVLGGGEKHAGSIAEYLGRYGAVDLVSHRPFSVSDLEERLGLDLSGCRKVVLPGYSERHAEELSREYDLWINASHHTSARSHARNSLLLVYFPISGPLPLRLAREIHPALAPQWLNQWALQRNRFWESYRLVLANSRYTAGWIRRWWKTEAGVLYPPVDLVGGGERAKTSSILSVGRFFLSGHNKRQDFLVRQFQELCDRHDTTGWEFHLCGGSQNEPWNRYYLRRLRSMARGYPIHIHADLPREELVARYRSASIYWHAAGYQRDQERFPGKMEHFGIATVEAMSSRCIPVVFDCGGQREIVDHGVSGYRWGSSDELVRWTLRAMEQQDADPMRESAALVARGYSADHFGQQLGQLLAPLGF